MRVAIEKFERGFIVKTPTNTLNVLTIKNKSLIINGKPFTGGMTLSKIERVSVDRTRKVVSIYSHQSSDCPIIEILYGKGNLLVNGSDLSSVKDEIITLGYDKFNFPEVECDKTV